MMYTRSTVPLLFAYAFLFIAGVFFLNYPSLQFTREDTYQSLITIWGIFYFTGGAISMLSAAARLKWKNNLGLWYFETAGLALTITANIVYAYALAKIGIVYEEYNVLALSFVICAFTSSLVGRVVDALRVIKVIKTAEHSTIPTMRG